jgi:hypothetical protein
MDLRERQSAMSAAVVHTKDVGVEGQFVFRAQRERNRDTDFPRR